MAASSLLLGIGIILHCRLILCSEEYVGITVTTNCTPPGLGDLNFNHSCISIDEAMEALSSDTEIFLELGTHNMARPHNVGHLRNISLTGVVEAGVYITCGDGIGLSFVNISGLTLANVVIQGCSLSGETLQDTMSTLSEILLIWFVMAPEIRVSLFLGHCQDLVMTNVTVNGTNGLGMLAINVMGDSVISYTKFTHNTRQNCIPGTPVYPFDVSPEVLHQTGGGAYFLYHDYINDSSFDSENHSLLVSNSYFAHNSDCSFSTLTHLNYRYIEDGVNRFTIGAAGGLSILYAHSKYSISAQVESSIFYRNDARYGAGAYVGSFIDFLYPNHVVFNNCSFVENGLASIAHDNGFSSAYCHSGGGLAVFTDLFKPSNLYKSILNVHNVSIFAIDTIFIRNEAAIEGGGIFALSLVNSPHRVFSLLLPDYFSVEWRLSNCEFYYNKAHLDSAASFIQRILHSVDGNVVLYFESITVRENGHSKTVSIIESDDEIYSTFSVNSVFTQFQGTSLFADNHASALHVVSAFIYLMDEAKLVFERNLGQRGGALFMEGESPGLFVSRNVTVVFRENLALVEGGAIYFGDSLYPTSVLDYHGCLVGTLPFSNLMLFSSGSTFEFYNNTAPIGSVIFGRSLEVCPWTESVSKGGANLFFDLYNDFNSTFRFDRAPLGVEQVSTVAASISVRVQDEILPGEDLDLEINVFDRFGSEIYAVVSSEVLESPDITSKLSGSRYFYTGSGTPTLQITGAKNQTIEVFFFTFINMVHTSVRMQLLTCPLGFDFHDGACECSSHVFEAQHSHHSYDVDSEVVLCDDSSITITTESGYWIGVESYLTNTSSSDIIVHECHVDYCSGNVTFRPPDYDIQCGNHSHRTGTLCGACSSSDGYSVVLGNSKCRKCSNYYLFLIPLFAVLGVLLFLAIAFLEFTMDKGWLCAVLFYCNIISIYSHSVFAANSIVHFLLIPAHFLSLEIGFSVCFFDGMTALSRVAIQFAFPLYLYLLMLISHILAQRYSLSCYFSPAKTFVTLMILSFVSLLNTCIEILAAHDIVTAGGIRSVRWLIDPNVLYFRAWHGLLGVIALVLLLGYLIPFPLSLSCPSLVYKAIRSAKPFFDAFYGPYKDRYRFWIGIRLITRALVIVAVKFFPVSISLVINLVILLTILHVQTSIQPYKSVWLGIVDSYFIINAAILYVGNLFNTSLSSQVGGGDLIFSCFFLGIANAVIATIFGYHIDMRFPAIRQKLTKKFRKIWSLIHSNVHDTKEVTGTPSEENSNTFPSTTWMLSTLPYEQPIELRAALSGRKEMSTPDSANYRDSILDTLDTLG